jgi:hypothetical protein
MAAGIGAAGIVGVAREAVPGTYVAPEQFIPIRSENLGFNQETIFTRPIQGVADIVHAVPGNTAVEGDIEFEVTTSTLPYLLYGMRGTVAKAGAAPPYTYTLTPTHVGQKSGADSTLSITIERNGIVFGYTQCVIGQLVLTVDDGLLIATASVLAKDEGDESAPTPVWPTDSPFGAGQYVIEIPTASQVYDVDTFSFTVNDNPEHAYRLRDDGRGAMFTKFGERAVELTMERDFDAKTDYAAYKALTAQEITIHAEKAADDHVEIIVNAAIKASYEVGLDGQGDLVRAAVTYQGIYDLGDTQSYSIEVSSLTEDIV